MNPSVITISNKSKSGITDWRKISKPDDVPEWFQRFIFDCFDFGEQYSVTFATVLSIGMQLAKKHNTPIPKQNIWGKYLRALGFEPKLSNGRIYIGLKPKSDYSQVMSTMKFVERKNNWVEQMASEQYIYHCMQAILKVPENK